ncbi:MAG TPA: SDR family oxidoreductase [Polyangiaceae bacterium]|nr:SDR family oxidoreductase [Polyangiaceae bacterium]HMR77260.1 SDR family oxidoreductase [Polyangiaceae bacterium]
MRVLVTGISGKVGQQVALLLAEHAHEVVGIDRRPWRDAPEGMRIHQADIRKRAAEDVFRIEKPDAVIHMATVTHLTAQSEDRYRINLGGTKAVFDFCHRYGVKHAVFAGRHTYYGAAADSVLYHTEDEPPLALETFPELADLVAADLFAGTALWRYPEIATAVLRIVYTLGPSKSGTLAAFLRGRRVPSVLGHDPLFQFMHEADVARALVLALEKGLRGVYNVAGPQPMPLSSIVRHVGHQLIPVPEVLFRLVLGRFGLPRLPPGALSHIKFPVVVDASAFVEKTGFKHSKDEYETLQDFRRSLGEP